MKTETPMKLAASSEFLSSDTYSLWYIQQLSLIHISEPTRPISIVGSEMCIRDRWYIQQRKLSLPSFEQHGVAFPLIVTESDILPVDVPVTRLQLSD